MEIVARSTESREKGRRSHGRIRCLEEDTADALLLILDLRGLWGGTG